MYQRVKELKRRHKRLLCQCRLLEQDQRTLLLKHALVHAWCDTFSAMQLFIAAHSSVDDGQQNPFLDPLLTEELALLSHYSPAPQDASRCHALLQELRQQDVQHTIYPYTEPSGYLLNVLSKPPFEGVSTMTAEDVASVMQQTVRTASFLLHRIGTASPLQQQELKRQLAQAWERYWTCFLSVVLLGHGDAALEAAQHINMETKVRDPTTAAAHQADQAAAVLPRLQLTAQQVEIFCASTSLVLQLLDTIHAERHTIQAQVQQGSESGGAGVVAAAAATSPPGREQEASTSRQPRAEQCCAALDGKLGASGSRQGTASTAAGVGQAAAAHGGRAAPVLPSATAAAAAALPPAAAVWDGAGSSSAAAGASSSSSSTSSSRRDLRFLDIPLMQQRLERQEALNDRLALLLRKEYFLRSVYVGSCIGFFTLEQMSLLGIMSYPFGMRVLFLGLEVMKQRDELLSQTRLSS